MQVELSDVSSFRVRLGLTSCCGKGGRDFVFAGYSDLTRPICSPPSPPPCPTPAWPSPTTAARRLGGGPDGRAREEAEEAAEEGAKFVSFPQEVFYKQMQEDREFAATLGFAIARTLSRKLGQAREDQQASGVALSLAAEADRTAAERRRDAGDVAADGGDGGWDGSAAQSADLSEYDVGMW